MINLNPKQKIERWTRESHSAIKIHFIKPNKVWSHYSKDTFFWNRGHAFKPVTLAPPPPPLLCWCCCSLSNKIRHNSVFLVLIVFCSVVLKPEIWFILFFQWMLEWLVTAAAEAVYIRMDDDGDDDDDAMATCRGAMISLSGVCWKSHIKWE